MFFDKFRTRLPTLSDSLLKELDEWRTGRRRVFFRVVDENGGMLSEHYNKGARRRAKNLAAAEPYSIARSVRVTVGPAGSVLRRDTR